MSWLPLLALIGAWQVQAPAEQLAWLEGEWICMTSMMAGGPTMIEEHWRRGERSMFGEIRSGLRSGTRVPQLDGWVQVATTRGSIVLTHRSTEESRALPFQLSESGAGRAVFTRHEAGATRRIAYRREGDVLTLTTEANGELVVRRYVRRGAYPYHSSCNPAVALPD